MYSARDDAVLPAPGFPIRESTDHSLFSGSPWLIAAVHALPRLLVPRHPPYALPILTVIGRSGRTGAGLVIPVVDESVQFSRSAKRRPPQTRAPRLLEPAGGGRSLKTQQHAAARARGLRGSPDPVDVARSRPRDRGTAAPILELRVPRTNAGGHGLPNGSLERR